jgi:hypothetical protein
MLEEECANENWQVGFLHSNQISELQSGDEWCETQKFLRLLPPQAVEALMAATRDVRAITLMARRSFEEEARNSPEPPGAVQVRTGSSTSGSR